MRIPMPRTTVQAAASIRRSACVLAIATGFAACAGPPATDPAPPRPRPTEEASVKPGINEAYLDPDLEVDEFVRRFEVESREVFVHRHRILAALDLQPGTDVADIGAGTGLFLRPFSRAVSDAGRVYAVELAPRFVDHLRERAQREGLDNVEVVRCTERSTELFPASVDVVFVCDTYHHFEYPQQTLASIHTALRPGGRLVILDFERIPGVSRPWILEHVRTGKAGVTDEVVTAGFQLVGETLVDGLVENYLLVFRRP